MNEQLTCTLCSQTWTRKRARGRKPLVCPSCIESGNTFIPSKSDPLISNSLPAKELNYPDISTVYKNLYPKSSSSEQLAESTKSGSTWKCPSCGNVLKINVAITDYPYHRCNPNSKSVVKYERIS